jgi:hypothetical protein
LAQSQQLRQIRPGTIIAHENLKLLHAHGDELGTANAATAPVDELDLAVRRQVRQDFAQRAIDLAEPEEERLVAVAGDFDILSRDLFGVEERVIDVREVPLGDGGDLREDLVARRHVREGGGHGGRET